MLTDYLKSLKAKQNLTNAQIAQMSGFSESTISRIMKGENKGTDLGTCVDIIKALGGSIDEACGITSASHACGNSPKSCTDCAKFASMKDEMMEIYMEEIRKDIIETTNQRMTEVYRINEDRVKREKQHYDEMLSASHKERIDNLMTIVNARAKTINRLSLITGAMAIALIALLILNIFFPTNPLLQWG